MAVAQAPAAPMGGGYPVQLTLTDEREINRLWGIPFVGVFVRMILAIPHMIVLGIMSIGLYIWLLLGWIPILLLGRQPSLVVKFLTEYLHRAFRVAGYGHHAAAGRLSAARAGRSDPVDLKIDVEGRSLSRLWGIPFVGLFVRYIVLIRT